MTKNRKSGFIYLFMAMFLAGSSVVAGKYLVHMPIFLSQTISLVFALIIIIPIAIIKEGSLRTFRPLKRDWVLLFLQGFSGVFLFRVFLLIGLTFSSAASSGIMLSTTPAVLAILSIIFLKERISGKIVVAIIMCVIGLLFINVTFGRERLPFDLMQLVGSLSIFISVISEALFTIFRKKQSFSTKPLTTTVFVMLFAFVLFLPVGLYQLHDYPFPMIRTNEWVAMIYYGVMCSALAYTCWFSGLARVKVGEAATMTGLLPVSSVLLSVIILGESVGVNQLIGMGFILIGIYVIMMKSRSKLDIAVSG